MSPHQITDKIYRIELPIPFPLATINVYYIDEPPRTLVDTGIKTDASFGALKTAMEALGFNLDSIERILITHGHIDHYGQAKKISSLSGAPIYIHSKEYERIRSIGHSLGILKMLLLRNGVPEVLVNEAVRFIESDQKMADPLDKAFFLKDGDTIPFESMSWRAIHCPGHSLGLLCFHWKEAKILFTGDHLLKGITPNPMLNIPPNGSPFEYTSLKQYIASLERIGRMDILTAFPGHGQAIHDPNDLIRKMLRHHQARLNLILSVLSRGDQTPYEIALALFPSVPPFEVFLVISEVLGHLEILKEKERVKAQEKAGIDYYCIESDRE